MYVAYKKITTYPLGFLFFSLSDATVKMTDCLIIIFNLCRQSIPNLPSILETSTRPTENINKLPGALNPVALL